jgi:hypothetical protein
MNESPGKKAREPDRELPRREFGLKPMTAFPSKITDVKLSDFLFAFFPVHTSAASFPGSLTTL